MALVGVGLKRFLRYRFPSQSLSSSISISIYGRAMTNSSLLPSTSPSKPTPPWLMLPPSIADGRIAYNLYNLSQDRVETGVQLPAEDEDDAVLVGSSHGWLAFFNRHTNHLFLSNPLSGRRLPLPPIHTLPDPEINLRHGRGTVSKLILSCSPDDHDHDMFCRAIISYGPGDRLAFCSLSHVHKCWTPIGSFFFEKFKPPNITYGRPYEDFVFCGKNKLFSCITPFAIDLNKWIPCGPTDMEDWDLRDPRSPTSRTCYWLRLLGFHGEDCSWLKENKELLQSCVQIPYLVFAQEYNQLFILTRFIREYKTVGFCVLKVVYSRNGLVVDDLRVADSLDGLAMFVGINHSFAVCADEFRLKPNSIYFTDAANKFLSTPSAEFRYDVGIFDYENKTFSPCPYSFSHDQSLKAGVVPLLPQPVWFTPSC